jgi:hypothetical protein
MRVGKRSVGGIFLGGFGLALALLMVYTLSFEGTGRRGRSRAPAGLIEVPVFFLERSEWRIFARGVAACTDAAHGLGRVLREDDDFLVVETARHRRPVRFTWHGVRGERQAREEVRRVVEADRPIAVIGGSNTVTTLALARGLRDVAGGTAGGPLLLVPWATSVELLGEYPGRTFRFCSNNRRLAGLLVEGLKAQPGRAGPRRVEMVVDRLDPYSVDLAECFRREVAQAFPKAEILDPVDETATSPEPRFSGRGALPTGTDVRHAREIWREVSEDPTGETWIILPIQNDPARRMLLALNGAAPSRHAAEQAPMTVIVGDAVGPTTLAWFANQLAFPVWAASAASNHAAERGLPEDVMEQAETVAALLIALDRPGPTASAEALRDALLHLGDPRPPEPFGRPLAFAPTGERLGFEPGEVFLLRPDKPTVFVYADDRWDDPRPVGPGGAP